MNYFPYFLFTVQAQFFKLPRNYDWKICCWNWKIPLHFSVHTNGSGVFQTRILVTNSVSILSQTDRIIVLDDGRITEQGTYTELLSHQGAFAQYIATYLQTVDDGDEEDEEEIGQLLSWWRHQYHEDRNAFSIIGPLRGESIGHRWIPLTNAIHAEWLVCPRWWHCQIKCHD